MEDLPKKWQDEVDNKPESVENLITTMKDFVQNCCSDGFRISGRMFKEVFPKIVKKIQVRLSLFWNFVKIF